MSNVTVTLSKAVFYVFKKLYSLAQHSVDMHKIYLEQNHIKIRTFFDTDCLTSCSALNLLGQVQEIAHFLKTLFYLLLLL